MCRVTNLEMNALLLPEYQLGHSGGKEHPADHVGSAGVGKPLKRHVALAYVIANSNHEWKFIYFHRPNFILAEGEQEAGEEEPEPEDLAVEAEKRPKGNVRYMRPVKYLEVTVPPVTYNILRYKTL